MSLEAYVRLRGLSPRTARNYLYWYRRWQASGLDPGEFLLRLQERSPASYNYALYALRAAGKATGQQLAPSYARALPQGPGGYCATLEDVRALWGALPRCFLPPTRRAVRAHLALAIAYGFRASEIASARLEGDTLIVQGAKRTVRTHSHVPPEVARHLGALRPVTYWDLRWALDQLRRASGRHRVTVHAIRRGLVTGLVQNGCPLWAVYAFMGWRLRGAVQAYFRPSPEAVDEVVFEHHPFMEVLRDGGDTTGPVPRVRAIRSPD